MARFRGYSLFFFVTIGGFLAMSCSKEHAQQRAAIRLPNPQPWPSVACTPEELERLRTAYKNGDLAEVDAFRRRGRGRRGASRRGRTERRDASRRGYAARADEVLERAVVFPPEGGQHNQWYQCDKCQLPLETVDNTHHRCASCGEVYTGYPYDNVIYSRQHGRLTRDMSVCAMAYALTGKENYAQRARDILVGYAERYMAYPYHSANMGKKTDRPSRSGGHVYEQTLNEASWMRSVCTAYDLVRLSGVFSEADHRAVREDFLLKVYENIAKHKAGKSNWQTYHNAAFMMIGGVLSREDLVRQAIEDPENGFYYQMDVSVLPGGMWYENSWGYHFYTLGAVTQIVETARRLGMDLYAVPQVKEMYTVALDYLMADGTLPRFGDATTTGISGRRYEAAYHRWKDPVFLALLPEGPTWDSVLYGRTESPASVSAGKALKSVLKAGAGHAILRADGPEGPSSAVMTFGPFGGFHGHFDKLSFVYYGMGRELGHDPGRARSQAYRLPVHKNWYRATTGHNAVLVDRKSQEGVEGNLELFVASPELSATAASVDRAYEGVLHRRLLVLRPGFLVVADVLMATDGADHVFDWMYHNRGEGISSPAAQAADDAPEGQGFEYLQDVRTGKADGTVRATVATGEDRVEVTVGAEAGTEVLTGTGVGESVMDRVPLVFVTRRGKVASFAAAVDPTRGRETGEVEDISIADHESSGYTVRVRLRDGSEEVYAYDPQGKPRKTEGVTSRAKLLCLRRETGGIFQTLTEAK